MAQSAKSRQSAVFFTAAEVILKAEAQWLPVIFGRLRSIDKLLGLRALAFSGSRLLRRRPCESLQDQYCGKDELKDCASVHLNEGTAVAARHHGGDCLGFLFWMVAGGDC
jgi:hypothetical protein